MYERRGAAILFEARVLAGVGVPSSFGAETGTLKDERALIVPGPWLGHCIADYAFVRTEAGAP